jgi:hypothetical protein
MANGELTVGNVCLRFPAAGVQIAYPAYTDIRRRPDYSSVAGFIFGIADTSNISMQYVEHSTSTPLSGVASIPVNHDFDGSGYMAYGALQFTPGLSILPGMQVDCVVLDPDGRLSAAHPLNVWVPAGWVYYGV